MKKFFIKILVLSIWSVYAKAQTCNVSFLPATHYTLSNAPAHVVSADFNGDGYLDLLVAQSNSLGTISLMLGSATGTFGSPITFTSGNGTNDLLAEDLNGDNNKDVVAANFSGNTISVLLGTGTGSFLPATNFTVAQGPRHLTSGDFNNDSKQDIAVSAANVASITVLLGNGAGSFLSITNYAVGSGPQGIVASHFNGDSNLDIVTTNSADNTISILLGTGTGSFTPQTTFGIPANAKKMTHGDFNSDGNDDVAVAHFQSPQVSVLFGTGTGSFSAFTGYVSGIGAVCYGITSADLNNDGSVDIGTPNNALSTAAVLLGSPNGTFAMGTGFAVQNVPLGITNGDFNNDGKIDLAVSNSGGSSISVLLNSTALPIVSIASSSSIMCSGQTATLSALGANTYSWNTSQINTNILVSPTTTTTYSVVGTSTNACSSTAIFTQSVIVCSGVDELTQMDKKFQIVPNPFTDCFKILSAESLEIEVFSMQGKKILSIITSEPKTVVDLKDQPSGIYFIRASNGLFTRKIIKD